MLRYLTAGVLDKKLLAWSAQPLPGEFGDQAPVKPLVAAEAARYDRGAQPHGFWLPGQRDNRHADAQLAAGGLRRDAQPPGGALGQARRQVVIQGLRQVLAVQLRRAVLQPREMAGEILCRAQVNQERGEHPGRWPWSRTIKNCAR